MKSQRTPYRRTARLQAEIDRYSRMTPAEIAPGQYTHYTPTFQTQAAVGTVQCSESNARTRYVGKGLLSVKNLLDAERITRQDDETEDVKELIMETLGEDVADGFGLVDEDEADLWSDPDDENFGLDIEP